MALHYWKRTGDVLRLVFGCKGEGWIRLVMGFALCVGQIFD
jgi:hypothetical protein